MWENEEETEGRRDDRESNAVCVGGRGGEERVRQVEWEEKGKRMEKKVMGG